MARRSIDDSESDFIALLTDLDERLRALAGRLPPAQLKAFDRRAEEAAKALNRAMVLTYGFIERADATLSRRPPTGNVITLRPGRRR